jgi:hypothetical protein
MVAAVLHGTIPLEQAWNSTLHAACNDKGDQDKGIL